MRIPKMNVFAGAMLSLLLSGVSVYPAMARPTGKVEAGPVIGQTSAPSNTSPSNTSPTSNTQTIRGTVKSIAGDVVTLQLPDGTTRDVTLQQGDAARLNLKPGTRLSVTLDDQNVASKVSVIRSSTSTTTTTTTTTRRRTVQAKPAPVQTQTTQQQPTTQSAPAQQSNAPVRALW